MIGTTLRIHFKALESALIEQPKAPNRHSAKVDGTMDDTLALRIVEIIRNNPNITLDQLAADAKVARRIVARHINALKEAGRIKRVCCKRYGH